MKTLREIRAAMAVFEEDMKGFAGALPVTVVSLVMWLALVPVAAVRDLLRWTADAMEPRRWWTRWMRS